MARQDKAQRQVSFLDLPTDAINDILGLLDFEDRLCLLACCKKLSSLLATSPSLCRDISVHLRTLPQLQQFTQALAAQAQCVRSLRLTTPWFRESHRGQMPQEARQQAVAGVAAALAAASALELLAWTPCEQIEAHLASWAPALPRLRSLTIMPYTPLKLPAGLGALPGLQELYIYEDWFLVRAGHAPPPSGIRFQPGCLPHSLRRLELAVQSLPELPPAILAATQLTQLAVGTGGAWLDLTPLSRLTALRALALVDFGPSEALLQLLPQLLLLELLELSCCRTRGWGARAPSGWEAGLGAVSELCLGHCGVRALGPELLSMPSLKALHLEGNPALALRPEALAACGIEELTLDVSAAVGSLEGVRALGGTLRRLRLANAADGGRGGTVQRIRRALEDMPAPFEGVLLHPGPSNARRAGWEERLAATLDDCRKPKGAQRLVLRAWFVARMLGALGMLVVTWVATSRAWRVQF